ncbi:hypothetical protein N7447_006706 [Penicillium robsamsonii]|uniref:uncharacterized protein n=1 Tax=Penicillium robsamsonii TaxID=1792511 RepID=UPI002547E34F|nr:uncharacterized protein N7447_006706 [Penicillium robsamsonii]KAJ5824366.1 hypothetical protein N7447_006706 [Penicillium robsamsonii]
MLPSLVLTAFALLPEVQAGVLHKRCGPISNYYNQHMEDWETYNTGDWLNNWWNNNGELIANNSGGFAGAFGQWAMGDPDWTCHDGGSDSNCDLQLCDNQVLNGRGDDIRPTYYVLESVNRLHSYFSGIGESFTTTALGAALSKDSWALTFYKDEDVKSVTALRQVLSLLTTIIGIGASFAGLGPAVVGVLAGAGSAIAGGASGAGGAALPAHADDTFEKSADMGAVLGRIVVDSMKSFTTANNQLMSGQMYGDADIRDYISGGAFLAFNGVDKNAVTDLMTNMLIGTAINQLYRTQKIFIMGGGACGDEQGIGSGPEASVVCRDGRAWYLYYWQENDVISLTSHRWGWVATPPGLEKLGQGDYGGISIADVINSSLDAWNVAGYNYNTETASDRASDAIKNSWASPGSKGASWEGIFTIPVCDVSNAIDSDYPMKEYILQPYGHDSRPVWCGPICNGDVQTTQDFIKAANMDGFKSPKHLCEDQPDY